MNCSRCSCSGRCGSDLRHRRSCPGAGETCGRAGGRIAAPVQIRPPSLGPGRSPIRCGSRRHPSPWRPAVPVHDPAVRARQALVSTAWPPEDHLDPEAVAAADLALTQGEATGAGTAHCPTVPWLFLPLRTPEGAVGVIGAALSDDVPSTLRHELCSRRWPSSRPRPWNGRGSARRSLPPGLPPRPSGFATLCWPRSATTSAPRWRRSWGPRPV